MIYQDRKLKGDRLRWDKVDIWMGPPWAVVQSPAQANKAFGGTFVRLKTVRTWSPTAKPSALTPTPG